MIILTPHKRSPWLSLTIGLMCTSLLSACGNKADGSAQGRNVKAALSVESTQPKQVTWPLLVKVNGGVFPWQEAQVSAEIGGLRIKQVLVDVGSEVKRGQDLVILADDVVLADLHKQEAQVDKDKANLAEAKSNADRAREIQNSGVLSTQKTTEYMVAEQTAKANLALSMAELENQHIRLNQTHVKAADDGVIASRTANLGNVVSAGAELFKLLRQSRIEWRGEVNANQLAEIKIGQLVRLMLSTGKSVKGVVRMTSPTIDTNTRNALVYVDIPKHSAKPGMYLQGNIDVGTQSALALVQSAVVMRDGHAYAFELQEASNANQVVQVKVIQRKVITGRIQGDYIEVLEGLHSNAKVVLTGGAFLNDGDTVKIIRSPVKASGA
jgi:RND family efflux transporter MFP subunit